jgi:hypothetical protein
MMVEHVLKVDLVDQEAVVVVLVAQAVLVLQIQALPVQVVLVLRQV